jgi:hypothetical protein
MRSWIAAAVGVVLLGTPVPAIAEYYDFGLDLSVYADASSYGFGGGWGHDGSFGYGGCGATFAGCGGGYELGGLYGSNWGIADTSLSYLVGINVSIDLGSYYGYGQGNLYGYGYGGCGFGGAIGCGGFDYGYGFGYDIGCSIGYCSGGILPYPQPLPGYPSLPGIGLPMPLPMPTIPICQWCSPIQNPFPIGYPPANPMPNPGLPMPIPQPVNPGLPVIGLPIGELPPFPTVRPPWGGCAPIACPAPSPVRPVPTLPYPTLPQPVQPGPVRPNLPSTQPPTHQGPGVPGGVGLPPSQGNGSYNPRIDIIGTPPDRNRVPRGNRSLP